MGWILQRVQGGVQVLMQGRLTRAPGMVRGSEEDTSPKLSGDNFSEGSTSGAEIVAETSSDPDTGYYAISDRNDPDMSDETNHWWSEDSGWAGIQPRAGEPYVVQHVVASRFDARNRRTEFVMRMVGTPVLHVVLKALADRLRSEHVGRGSDALDTHQLVPPCGCV